MIAPRFGLGAVVSVLIDDRPRTGRVVGVFVDGSRAASHFRCRQCDYAGGERSGMTPLTPLHDGVVYLVADDDGEFLARNDDARAELVRQAGPVVTAATETSKPEARAPTISQRHHLRAIARVAKRGPVYLANLRLELPTLSMPALQEHVRRLEAKGLVRRHANGANEHLCLTDAARRWLAAPA